MTIELELDTADLVDELTESSTFTSWLEERINEAIPEGYELPDDVMRDSQLNDHARSMLDSLPHESADRCTLGKSFEHAVVKVLMNVLRGDEMATQTRGHVDGALMEMVERVVPGALTARQVVTTHDAAVHAEGERLMAEEQQPDPDAMVREVLVVVMSGDRDNEGTVTVWTNDTTTLFEVRRLGRDPVQYTSEYEAFTEAFSRASWGVRCSRLRG